MKKLLQILGIILAFMVFLTGCNSSQPEENNVQVTEEANGENRLEKIKESGRLVIGPDGNYPPFGYHKQVDGNDVITGFDIFIAEEIANDLGVDLEIVDMEFAATLTGVQSGMLDIAIGAINPTEDRKEVMNFSDDYFTSTFTVLVNVEDAGKFNSADKLSQAGARVGVQTATVQEKIAENIDGITVVSLAKTPDLVLQLQSGLIDAIITENTVSDLYERSDPDLYSEPEADLGDMQEELGVAIAVQKNQPELIDAINDTLDRLKDEGKLEEYYEKALEDFTSQD